MACARRSRHRRFIGEDVRNAPADAFAAARNDGFQALQSQIDIRLLVGLWPAVLFRRVAPSVYLGSTICRPASARLSQKEVGLELLEP